MKKMKRLCAVLLSVALALCALPALAGDAPVRPDAALVAQLFPPAEGTEAMSGTLPGYTYVEGVLEDGLLRMLARRPEDHALVFVGGVNEGEAGWKLTVSTPLPEGTILGVENFTTSLGIPAEDYYHAVTLSPFEDGSWGVTLMIPRSEGLFLLGPNWAGSGEGTPAPQAIGFSPWRDVTTIDWDTLPLTWTEAAAALDRSNWAVVSNPNPADRLNLREKPDIQSGSLGKYYNGTPVQLVEYGKEWCYVNVGYEAGWMMTEYLAFDGAADAVRYAGPWLHAKDGPVALYSHAKEAARGRDLNRGESFIVIGVVGEEWVHIWLPDAGAAYYVKAEDLTPGNG